MLIIGRQIVKIRCSSQTQQQGTRWYSPLAAAIGDVAASITPDVCSPLAACSMFRETSQIEPCLAPCDRAVSGSEMTAAAVVPSSPRSTHTSPRLGQALLAALQRWVNSSFRSTFRRHGRAWLSWRGSAGFTRAAYSDPERVPEAISMPCSWCQCAGTPQHHPHLSCPVGIST